MKNLQSRLASLKQKHLFRRRRVLQSPQGVEIRMGDSKMLSFCSNDYLGLANHPVVVEALIQGANKYGVGAGASHLVSGHMTPHHLLEEELAEFIGADKALLFSTGYMANQAIVTSLTDRHSLILEDRLNHASLIDATRLSGAKVKRYAHADVQKVETIFTENHDSPNTLITTDAVFSMDGDLAPLSELVHISRENNAWLLADDAHGLGVLGQNGRGSFNHLGLEHEPHTIYMGTLGKAIGTAGAFVAGTEELIETLIQQGRTYIYTTAMPPAIAEATRAAIRLLSESDALQQKLLVNIGQFRTGASELGLKLMESITAIQPIVFGTSDKALAAASTLAEENILVPAIRPPTVPEGTARLRVTLSASHTSEQINLLLDVLSRLPRFAA